MTTGRRGHRRVRWIEAAVAPLRSRLSRAQHERLVSGLTVLLGWEATIQLRSMRALGKETEARVIVWATRALVEATLAEVDRRKKKTRTRGGESQHQRRRSNTASMRPYAWASA
jgi:hypothetical protein